MGFFADIIRDSRSRKLHSDVTTTSADMPSAGSREGVSTVEPDIVSQARAEQPTQATAPEPVVINRIRVTPEVSLSQPQIPTKSLADVVNMNADGATTHCETATDTTPSSPAASPVDVREEKTESIALAVTGDDRPTMPRDLSWKTAVEPNSGTPHSGRDETVDVAPKYDRQAQVRASVEAPAQSGSGENGNISGEAVLSAAPVDKRVTVLPDEADAEELSQELISTSLPEQPELHEALAQTRVTVGQPGLSSEMSTMTSGSPSPLQSSMTKHQDNDGPYVHIGHVDIIIQAPTQPTAPFPAPDVGNQASRLYLRYV